MFPEFLFSGFTSKKKDYVQALAKISDSVESILDVLEKHELSAQAKDYENAKSHIKNLEWQIDKFPFSTFQFLERSFYLRRRSRFKSVEVETRATLSSLEKKIAVMQKNGKSQEELPESDRLIEINGQISNLTKGVESFYSKINFAAQSIYLVPLVGVYFLGVYYRLEKGFEVVSEKILWPEQAYVTSESDRNYHEFSKPYADKYWLEFSKYYFDRSNSFAKLYARDDDFRQYLSDKNSKKQLEEAVASNSNYGYEDSPDGSRRYFKTLEFGEKNSLVAKFVLQNDSKTKPVLVHDLNVKLDLTDDFPFPWENLVVTANVKEEVTNTRIPRDVLTEELNSRDQYLSRELEGEKDAQKFVRLEDAGIGPVIDLNWTVTANKLKLTGGNQKLFYYKSLYISVNKAPSGYSFVVPLDDGSLKYPFFLKGSAPVAPESTASDGEPYFKFIDDWYEKISTLERLCQITQCTEAKEVYIDYSFYSLRGEKSVKRSTAVLSKPRVYYQMTADLKMKDPRTLHLLKFPRLGKKFFFEDMGACVMDKVSVLLPALIGEPSYLYKPKGVDLFSQDVYLDLDYGHSAYFNQNLDVILNPSGYIVTNITVQELTNGIYTLNLQINNQTASSMKFEYLKPEKWRFLRSDVNWLREKLEPTKKPLEKNLVIENG